MNENRAFTLLEVLISLSILSIVAVISVQQIGRQQESIAFNLWQDTVIYKEREILTNIIQSKNYEQSGTLAPENPKISWKSEIKTIDGQYQLKILSVNFKNENSKSGQSVIMEYILP